MDFKKTNRERCYNLLKVLGRIKGVKEKKVWWGGSKSITDKEKAKQSGVYKNNVKSNTKSLFLMYHTTQGNVLRRRNPMPSWFNDGD